MKKHLLIFLLICSAFIYAGCSKMDDLGGKGTFGPVVKMDFSVGTVRQALWDLYNATDGENWSEQPNWNSTDDMEDWTFIRLDSDRMLWFDLDYDIGMNGTLPSSFFDLPWATVIIARNNLTGPLPDNVGKNGLLHYLSLSKNQITGSIPVSLANSTLLNSLELDDNQMSGKIPDEIRNMVYFPDFSLEQQEGFGFDEVTIAEPSTEDVNVLMKMYEKFSDEMKRLFNWESVAPKNFNHVRWNAEGRCVYLNFNNKPDVVIGDEINQLTGLQELWFQNSDITSFPESLVLPELNLLVFSRSDIKKLPDISHLKKLQVLLMEECSIRGEMPAYLNNLTQLKVLVMTYHRFYGTIPDLSHLRNLVYLDLSGDAYTNSFVPQPFPEWITGNPNLRVCDLSYCNLSGEIPSGVGHLPALKELILRNNFLDGSIEKLFAESSEMHWFDYLDLKENSFNGKLPEFHPNMPLKTMYLSDCAFSGSLPENWKNLKLLQYVWVDGNELTGTLPVWLLEIPQIELRIHNNMMAGHFGKGVTTHDRFRSWQYEKQKNGELTLQPEE